MLKSLLIIRGCGQLLDSRDFLASAGVRHSQCLWARNL